MGNVTTAVFDENCGNSSRSCGAVDHRVFSLNRTARWCDVAGWEESDAQCRLGSSVQEIVKSFVGTLILSAWRSPGDDVARRANLRAENEFPVLILLLQTCLGPRQRTGRTLGPGPDWAEVGHCSIPRLPV